MRNGGEALPDVTRNGFCRDVGPRLTLRVTASAPLTCPASASTPPLEGCIEAREP
jgi:hypothetical protein